MTVLKDQFAGGIDPLQNHRDLGVLETRQTRYAVRVSDYDQHGFPVVERSTIGDVLCASHWSESSRPIGGWAHAWPVTGGSPVMTTNYSSTKAAQQSVLAAQNAAAKAASKGKGGASRLQIGIGLDPGGFDVLGGTGQQRTFGLPNGYFFGIDAQTAGLGIDAQFAINDGPTRGYASKSGDPHWLGDFDSAQFYGRYNWAARGSGGLAADGRSWSGAAGPMGAAGQAGDAAFGPNGGISPGRTRVITGESGGGGAINVLPVKNSTYAQDVAFQRGQVRLPDGFPSLVQGSVGTVLAGTEHTRQEPVYLHGDPRLVSVNEGPDPSASSVVFDTEQSGKFDPSLKAKMHSAWRVMAPFVGFPAFGPGGTLAWQLSTGERDGVAGLGAVVDTSNTATATSARAPVTTTSAPSNAAQASPVKTLGNGIASVGYNSWTLGGAFFNAAAAANAAAWSAAQAVYLAARGTAGRGSGAAVAANVGARAGLASNIPTLTAGLMSAGVGGPIEVGHGTRDKHALGTSGDHAVNAGHLSVDALFYRNEEADAPVNFELDYYPGADDFPLRSKVHLQYNPNVNHNASIRTLAASGGINNGTRKFKGRWDLWAEVPNTKEGGEETPPPGITPPLDPPPTTPPVIDPPAVVRPKRTTIGGWPIPPTPGTSGGPIGWDGDGGPGRGGAGTADLPTEPPAGRILAKALNRGRGGMYQQVAATLPFVRVPGSTYEGDGDAMTMPDVAQSRLNPVRERDGVAGHTDQFTGFPSATAHTVLLFRPQHTHRSMRDLRSSVRAPESMIRRQLADRPVTLRAEAFGAEAGLTFTKTQRSGSSRFPGGTGSGGIAFLPPELDLLDVERTTYVPTASTSYLVAHPGVWWASGYARKANGDVKTGYRWGTNSSGDLIYSRMSSAGVATTVFTADAAGAVNLTAWALGGVVSATVGASQNNYAPTGLSTAGVLRLDANVGAINITGLSAQPAGRVVTITNIGTNAITLRALSGSSTAANQFGFSADAVLAQYDSKTVWYDGTSLLWRPM